MMCGGGARETGMLGNYLRERERERYKDVGVDSNVT